MNLFDTLNLKSRIFLAPLAGFSDAGFRALCMEHGAGLTYTEMVSAKGLCFGGRGTEPLLFTEPVCTPRAVQLFGCEPEFMKKAAADERLAGFDVVDINMGCPVKKVFSNGDGSALMAHPALIEDIVRATSEGCRRPVTVKIRAGIHQGEVLAVECALAAERGGAAAVTVHPRFREQMYAGIADHTVTVKVKEALTIPVIANGDISDAESYFAVRRMTRADAYMVGRGALGRPWLFEVLGALDRLSDDEIYSADGTVRTDARAYARRARKQVETCIQRRRCRKTPRRRAFEDNARAHGGERDETAPVSLRKEHAARKSRPSCRGKGVRRRGRLCRRRRIFELDPEKTQR